MLEKLESDEIILALQDKEIYIPFIQRLNQAIEDSVAQGERSLEMKVTEGVSSYACDVKKSPAIQEEILRLAKDQYVLLTFSDRSECLGFNGINYCIVTANW